MKTIWHEHFFVPGGDGELDRFDAVEYEDGTIVVINVPFNKLIACSNRESARRIAERLATGE